MDTSSHGIAGIGRPRAGTMRARRGAHLTTVALLLAIAAPPVHALVLCATRTGAVVGDERCRKREQPLEARDLGVIPPAGPVGPAGPAGPAGAPVERVFGVVDANGTTVCRPLARDAASVQCILEPEAEGAPVQLVLTSDGANYAPPEAVYEAAGCVGPQFVAEAASLITRAMVVGTRLLIPTGAKAIRTVRSREQDSETCATGVRTPYGTCCTNLASGAQATVAPARAVALATLGLTPPFHLEMR